MCVSGLLRRRAVGNKRTRRGTKVKLLAGVDYLKKEILPGNPALIYGGAREYVRAATDPVAAASWGGPLAELFFELFQAVLHEGHGSNFRPVPFALLVNEARKSGFQLLPFGGAFLGNEARKPGFHLLHFGGHVLCNVDVLFLLRGTNSTFVRGDKEGVVRLKEGRSNDGKKRGGGESER